MHKRNFPPLHQLEKHAVSTDGHRSFNTYGYLLSHLPADFSLPTPGERLITVVTGD